MEHKGLEPKIDDFQNSDNRSKNTDIKSTHHPNNKHFTKIKKSGTTEGFGHISDSEKHIIDTLRAQYEHNEIPKELVKLIRAWSSIPESVSLGIIAMTNCYLELEG